MAFDGSSGLIAMAIVAVVFFGLLIGGLAWMYGRQSAKRRNAQAVSKSESKGVQAWQQK